MKVAFIPARGGSKRIPRKNIRMFCGRPMIAWSIEAARESGLFDRIVVSTEDDEVAAIARHWGAEVPFKRPAELSDDHAGTTEVIGHATQWALNQGWALTAVCCIYATAPFIRAIDLQRGLEALESGDWLYAFAVAEFSSSIFRAFRELPEGGLEMFFPDRFLARTQDLPVALHDAGQFYWGRPEAWIERKMLFARYSAPVVLPRWRMQDIDNEDDWRQAEMLAAPIIARKS